MYILNYFSKRGLVQVPYASIDKNNRLTKHDPIKYIKLPFSDYSALTAKIEQKIMYLKSFFREKKQSDVSLKIIEKMKLMSEKSNIAYFCGDNVSYDLDLELTKEGFKINKIINYTSEKITDLNEQNKKIISSHPPDIIFVYSTRSAISFIEIVKKYSLYPLMTGSEVMCISKKVADIFSNDNWKKVKTFNPGEELLQLGER